jgi:ribosome-binding factor A
MGQDRRRRQEPPPDGTDPTSMFSLDVDRRRGRKERQLCRQVQEALGYALPALRDEILRDLWVISVEPAPDAARLCAVVEAPRGAALDEVYARLDRAAGLLRNEVAQAITRKRTPTLTFRVLPAGAGAEEGEG